MEDTCNEYPSSSIPRVFLRVQASLILLIPFFVDLMISSRLFQAPSIAIVTRYLWLRLVLRPVQSVLRCSSNYWRDKSRL
ncbi:hypothetical protein BDW62DRAFT_192442 [Aspergillus aurantiobrunneus]